MLVREREHGGTEGFGRVDDSVEEGVAVASTCITVLAVENSWLGRRHLEICQFILEAREGWFDRWGDGQMFGNIFRCRVKCRSVSCLDRFGRWGL